MTAALLLSAGATAVQVTEHVTYASLRTAVGRAVSRMEGIDPGAGYSFSMSDSAVILAAVMAGGAHATVIKLAPVIQNAPVIRSIERSSGSSTIEGIAITAAVSLLVAVAGGTFLLRSTKNTITAEADRQREALKEQFRQQSHETDLEEVRRILDAIASGMFALWALVNESYEILGTFVIPNAMKQAMLHNYGEHLHDIARTISRESRGVADQVERLRLRLGRDGDDLISLATKVREQSDGLGNQLLADALFYEDPAGPEELISQQFAAVRDGRQEFTDAALVFTRARLRKPEADSA